MSTIYCVTPPPTPSTWGPTFTVSRVTPLLRSCTWSHISTVFSMIPSRPWTWGHVSMVSSVIPLHKHCIWAHTSTVSSVTPPPTLSNWDHMSTVQGNPASQAVYLESFTVSMVTSSQAMHLGSHVYSLKVTSPLSAYTWSHMSTIPRVYPSQTLCLGLHVHILHGDPPPTPCTLVTCPESTG